MSVVFVVLPLALILAAAAVAAFAWALRGGQLDDLETPAVRMLLDDHDESPDRDRAVEADEATAPDRTGDGSTPDS